MSRTLDVLHPDRPKRIQMVVANPATSPVTGWPVGFWWGELTHPYLAFTEAGYEVAIASPAGGALMADSFSDPLDPSDDSAEDLISLGFATSPRHRALIEDTPALAAVDLDAADALFLVGGQSPMVTFAGDRALHDAVGAFVASGRPTAVVCHATCVLLEARTPAGDLVVAGRTWTGFADAEEEYADAIVGRRMQPFRIEERARAMKGTNFITAGPFRSHAVRDGNLITGQQQYSGAAAARLVVEALGV